MTEPSAAATSAPKVELDTVIHFPDGLLGFPDELDYRLTQGPAAGLYWLLPAVGPARFLLSDPFRFFAEYSLDLTPEQAVRVDADVPSDIAVLAITIPHRDGPWTANLQGPLVINARKGVGAQLVLAGSGPGVREPFVPTAGPQRMAV